MAVDLTAATVDLIASERIVIRTRNRQRGSAVVDLIHGGDDDKVRDLTTNSKIRKSRNHPFPRVRVS